MKTLEEVIKFVKKHDEKHPDHGIGCACLDEASRALWQTVRQLPVKTQANLRCVFYQVIRKAL